MWIRRRRPPRHRARLRRPAPPQSPPRRLLRTPRRPRRRLALLPALPPRALPRKAHGTKGTWRGKLEGARTALTRAQLFQDALQSRINALSTDFVNRDDPAQRAVIAADRQKALAELDRVKQEIAQNQKAIVAIQEEGRRAGAPAGWLR